MTAIYLSIYTYTRTMHRDMRIRQIYAKVAKPDISD